MPLDVVEPGPLAVRANQHDGETLGNMLGLGPKEVSQATAVLKRAGLIYYDNGEITVLDRPGVEKRSCECYGVVKNESDRLLPHSVGSHQRPA